VLRRKNMAIFASGEGSNAQKIIEYFNGNDKIRVSLIVSNNPAASVLEKAARADINHLLINKEEMKTGTKLVSLLKENQIDLIVLAGFLWLIPSYLIKAYPEKIINIHPSLLPKFGGKGMYGMHVHQAVLDANEKETGISIHLVDEVFDHGKVIFQAKCAVEANDSAQALAQKVHALEHEHYAKVLESFI